MEVTAKTLERMYSAIEACLMGGQFPTDERIAMYLGASVEEHQAFVYSWFHEFGPSMGNLEAVHAAAFAALARSVTQLPVTGVATDESSPTRAVAPDEPFLTQAAAFSSIVECVKAGFPPMLEHVRRFVGPLGTDDRVKRCIAVWLNRYAATFSNDVRTARMSILMQSSCSWEYHVESRLRERARLH